MPRHRIQPTWPQIRIADEREISAIFRIGRRLKNREFTVIYRTNQSTRTRFGILVGRRLGGAVVRNRVKRRVREIVRQPVMQYGPYDLLILPQAAAAPLPLAALRERLLGLLDQLS